MFDSLIKGIGNENDRAWYAAIMLNRLMFSWFLQSKGFLDGKDPIPPRQATGGLRRGRCRSTNFHSFYQRSCALCSTTGSIKPVDRPRQRHEDHAWQYPLHQRRHLRAARSWSTQNPGIQIPDKAFEDIFALFGKYTWHLDDRPIAGENEINPDVLGHIFEKFVNQKEKGAYYTKEDVTGYISQNTIIPWLLDRRGRTWRSLSTRL